MYNVKAHCSVSSLHYQHLPLIMLWPAVFFSHSAVIERPVLFFWAVRFGPCSCSTSSKPTNHDSERVLWFLRYARLQLEPSLLNLLVIDTLSKNGKQSSRLCKSSSNYFTVNPQNLTSLYLCCIKQSCSGF